MAATDPMRTRCSALIDQIPPSGIRKFFDLVMGAKDIISLGVGEPDFVTPWRIREDAIYSLESGQTSYTSNQGIESLRIAIATYLHDRFHAEYTGSSEILVTVGVSEAIDLVLRTILNPGDEVILPEPTYVCYAPLIQLAGGVVIPSETASTAFIPDPDLIRRQITPRTKAIVLCSPNNPTGAVIPEPVLHQIADIAKEANLWVLADEIYGEISYGPFTSFASLPGMKSHTILFNGFSKAFAMTGWRLGYIAAPDYIIANANKIHQYSMLCAPITSQVAALEALRSGCPDVEMMRQTYESRRNFCLSAMAEMGLPCTQPTGAFYIFPDIRKTGLSSADFALQLLAAERVAVVPGSVFGVGGEGFIRCCYATDIEKLKIALERMGRFVTSRIVENDRDGRGVVQSAHGQLSGVAE